MPGDYLEEFTYDYILESALANVPDTVDRRPGSIIYDALSPACYELADFYMRLRQNYLDTFVTTARDTFLDLRMQEQGLSRYEATYAIKKGRFLTESGEPLSVDIGSRFSILSDTETINYAVLEGYADDNGVSVPGVYKLQCETPGSIGNQYSGELVPIDFIHGLATATLSETLLSGDDQETDEAALERYLQAVNEKSFGGNIAQYREMLRELEAEDGRVIRTGSVQVYPAWDGGGTVLLSVVNPDYHAPEPEEIQTLQTIIDPENADPAQPDRNTRGAGLGLAPIGHKVTVTAPSKRFVALSADIAFAQTMVLDQLKGRLVEELEAAFQGLRQSWGTPDRFNNYALAVYVAQISAALLRVPGVNNVTNTRLDGEASDIILTQDPTKQELPMMGEVSINGTVIFTP